MVLVEHVPGPVQVQLPDSAGDGFLAKTLYRITGKIRIVKGLFQTQSWSSHDRSVGHGCALEDPLFERVGAG